MIRAFDRLCLKFGETGKNCASGSSYHGVAPSPPPALRCDCLLLTILSTGLDPTEDFFSSEYADFDGLECGCNTNGAPSPAPVTSFPTTSAPAKATTSPSIPPPSPPQTSFPGNGTLSPVLSSEPRATPTEQDPPSTPESAPLGIVIGGIVGAGVLVAGIMAMVIYSKRRDRHSGEQSTNGGVCLLETRVVTSSRHR